MLLVLGLGVALALSIATGPGSGLPATWAIGSLETIETAQQMFHERDADNDGVANFATLEELARANLIDPVLGSGTKQGYRYEVGPGADATKDWMAIASPLEGATSESRGFAITADGSIFWTSSGVATITSDCRPPKGWRRLGER